jgi:glyoxylase I family protein
MTDALTTGAVHHLRLTVADPNRSCEFYTGLLGFEVLMTLLDGVLVSNGALMLALRTAPDPGRARGDDRFDPNRPGLDHLAINVVQPADLEVARELCRTRGVTCGDVVDLGPDFDFMVLMMEDPDGIQIELTAPRESSSSDPATASRAPDIPS